MILTFDLATWYLFRTYRLVMMIICPVLFSNPTMHNKVMGRKQTGFTEVYAQSLSADCDLDLRPNDMVLVRDTSSCHDDHLCQTIFKSHHVWPGHYSGTHIYTGKTPYALPPFYGRGIKMCRCKTILCKCKTSDGPDHSHFCNPCFYIHYLDIL